MIDRTKRHLARSSLLAAFVAVATSCAGEAPRPKANPTGGEEGALVRVAPVEREVTRTVRAAGVLRASREIDLSFKVGGILRRVAVERGAVVHRGDVLAEIDPAEVEASVRQASENATKARRDADRAKTLGAGNAVPKSVVDDAETGYAVAEAALAAASFNARQRVLVAPQDGVVDARLAEPGEVVGPGRPIVHLSGTAAGWVVRADLVDRDAVRVTLGQPVRVTVDAFPDLTLDAKLSQRSPAASRGTGTFEIEATLEPSVPKVALLSGLSAKVRLDRPEPGITRVPVAAVVDADGTRGAVFAVEGGRARRIPVDIAFLEGDRVGLASDLAGVVEIATEGAARLKDGARVRVDRNGDRVLGDGSR